jgi:outer membrane protein OmpA-like peptidoglycan-associated protein
MAQSASSRAAPPTVQRAPAPTKKAQLTPTGPVKAAQDPIKDPKEPVPQVSKPDRDHDGVPDGIDACPDQAEDKDGYEDEDGCPESDNDKDGIPDAVDKCPNEPETINNIEDDDGCPDGAPAGAAAHHGPVPLPEALAPIPFKADRARVRHAFKHSLDEAAAFLKAHPEVGRCGVEGQADVAGPQDWNWLLAKKRAQVVIDEIVKRGVDPKRLVLIEQGDPLPWAPQAGPATPGRGGDKQVVFHLESPPAH